MTTKVGIASDKPRQAEETVVTWLARHKTAVQAALHIHRVQTYKQSPVWTSRASPNATVLMQRSRQWQQVNLHSLCKAALP
jgi:hypothetical protein